MDWGATIANIVLSLSVTVFGYLLVPIIVILKGNKYDAKKLKRINRINCVVVWILFRIIRTAINGEPGTGAAVFLWGAVGQWLLNKYCLEETTQNTPHKENPTQVQTTQPSASSQKPVKYCSRCGKPIDPKTKKCQNCGKQYFKGISVKKVVPYVLLFITVSSVVCNVCLFLRIDEQAATIQKQQTEIATYKKTVGNIEEQKNKYFDLWNESLHEIAFYDQYIVFVADDGSNLYHNYDCKKFQDCTSFWVYGFDGAKDNGYTPCPLCHD